MENNLFKKIKEITLESAKKAKFVSKLAIKNKSKIAIFVIIGLLVFWLGGFFTGWWLAQGRLGKFQTINANTKLLVISPHPDDEVLIAGGLIQEVLNKKGKVKIIYLTTGDSSVGSVIRIDKNLKLSPNEFLDLAEKRRNEAIRATKTLGLNADDLIFLAFPDQGLNEVLERDGTDSRGPVISRSTKLDHVVYSWAYNEGQNYNRQELLADVEKIIQDFKPTIVVVTHPRDSHPDHKAAAQIIEAVESETRVNWETLFSVIHYRGYPVKEDYLFPPRKLFNNNWVSFDLTGSERSVKRQAILEYSSQVNDIEKGWYLRFDTKNEIFETE